MPKRENAIVNRLNKTKYEKFPNLQEEKLARQREISRRNQEAVKARVSSFPQDSFCRSTSVSNISIEQGRGSNSQRKEGSEVSEGTCL